MAYYQEEEEKKSKYNAAVAQLYRLDTLWQGCHFFRAKGNLINWNYRLDCIWTELASDSNTDDGKKFNFFMKLIVRHRKNRTILNQVLMEKEIFLRKLQNKQGKGTAYVDESEDDFD